MVGLLIRKLFLRWNKLWGARNRVGIGLSYRPASAVILEQSLGASNRIVIELSYRLARLHRLAESIPWNQFLSSLKVKNYRFWSTLQRNLDLCIPRKGIARPQSQYPYPCVCERFIYSHVRSTYCPEAE